MRPARVPALLFAAFSLATSGCAAIQAVRTAGPTPDRNIEAGMHRAEVEAILRTGASGYREPVPAFGLTIITPEEPGAALFDDDLLLLVPGEPRRRGPRVQLRHQQRVARRSRGQCRDPAPVVSDEALEGAA